MEKDKALSIYVHIPFCQRKCLYCDFLSFNAEKDVVKKYFSALKREIMSASDEYKDYRVETVFFGGGTPSFPEADEICSVLDLLKNSFDVDSDAEISIEVNPASAISDKLIAYKAAGINRLSIGAQSLNDEELKCLGRLHNADMFFETYDNAVKAGFTNINVDVMSALPGQSISSYIDTLRKVLLLKPEHISAYSLIIEEGTPFYDMKLMLPDEETDRLMYHETGRILAEYGYHRYEISNYALERECQHNKVYWNRGNYLGLGLGAASMVENVRWKNTDDFSKYLSAPQGEIKENVERLSRNSQMEEFMFLGLRLTKGVGISRFEQEFGMSIFKVYGDVIERYTKMGLLDTSDGYLFLTDEGLDVSNTVMADFIF